MVSIARKNLFHDKGRLVITLLGLAVVLVMALAGMGMYSGTLNGMLLIIDKSKADVWVTQEGTSDAVNASILKDHVVDAITKVNGVAKVHKLVAIQGQAEKDGKSLNVFLVGFDVNDRIIQPWQMVSGRTSNLAEPNSIILDRSAERDFGLVKVGDLISIGNRTERVVGVSAGAKSFIYSYVFTSYKNAQALSGLQPNQMTFLLVNVAPGADPKRVATDISKIKGVAAFTSADIRTNTINYMTFKAGMGVGIGIMVLIGLIVAAIIIALTIYTATMDRIPEFGTLKAIGASRLDIYRILMEQMLLTVTIGYAIGIVLSFAVGILIDTVTPMPVLITPVELIIGYIVTLGLSVLGSYVSIRRVNKVDPAIVFRA